MVSRAIVTAVMLASSAAFAQGTDAGPAPLRCGATLTDDGACYGAVAAWCEEPNEGGSAADAGVRTLDCAALADDDGSCVVLAEVGAFCGVAEGGPCALGVDDGVVQLACLSGGALDDGAVCDLEDGCVSGAPCTTAGRACEGDVLRLTCAPFGQALVVDCVTLGGRCSDDTCVDVTEGGRCGAGLTCADDLVCVGSDRGLGTCLPPGSPVASADPPADDLPPPPASCSEAGAASSAAGFLLGWLLVSPALVRRRASKRSCDRCRAASTR